MNAIISAQANDPATKSDPVLTVKNLRVDLGSSQGAFVVDGISFDISAGEVLGIVGESGSGKSVTVRSLIGLIAAPLKVTRGQAIFEGNDLFTLRSKDLKNVRGGRIGMVFQDPLASLNPLQRCGDQIDEMLRIHSDLTRDERRRKVIELFGAVGIPDPTTRVDQYPHEFSGGMRQRVMIAMAIANSPALVIADEPTTALDVTIQAQVMELFRKIGRQNGRSMILVSHDLGLIAENCDRILVLYSGRTMEVGPAAMVLRRPAHPYTRALLDARPKLDRKEEFLATIPGRPPSLGSRPPGCPFHPRCTLAKGRELCAREVPELRTVPGLQSSTACHFAHELVDGVVASTKKVGAL